MNTILRKLSTAIQKPWKGQKQTKNNNSETLNEFKDMTKEFSDTESSQKDKNATINNVDIWKRQHKDAN